MAYDVILSEAADNELDAIGEFLRRMFPESAVAVLVPSCKRFMIFRSAHFRATFCVVWNSKQSARQSRASIESILPSTKMKNGSRSFMFGIDREICPI